MLFYIKEKLKYVFLKRKYWICIYFIVMLIFPIFCKANNYIFDELLLINIGLKFNNNFIFSIIYLFNLIFYISIFLELVMGNIKIGVDNLFLRLNKVKIIISNLVSGIITLLLISTLLFSLLNIIYYFLALQINDIFKVFIVFIISRIIVSIILVILINIYLYSKKYFFFSLVILILIINKNYIYFIQIYLFQYNMCLLFTYFIAVVVNYLLVLKKTIIKLFERSF